VAEEEPTHGHAQQQSPNLHFQSFLGAPLAISEIVRSC